MPDSTDIPFSRFRQVKPKVVPFLSPRQRQIAALIIEGHPHKEIAYRLGISHGTVKVYVCGLLRKTGCESRLQFAVQALKGEIPSLKIRPSDGALWFWA